MITLFHGNGQCWERTRHFALPSDVIVIILKDMARLLRILDDPVVFGVAF